MPEFAEKTLQTLATVESLKKYRGHVLNWYDTRSLQTLAPLFVSSVDSGNLLASLWTLEQGCLDRLQTTDTSQPCLADGLFDYLRELATQRVFPKRPLENCERERNTDQWLKSLLDLPETIFEQVHKTVATSRKAGQIRLGSPAKPNCGSTSIRQTVSEYAPVGIP